MNHIGVRVLAGVTAAFVLLSALPGIVYAADMEMENSVTGTQETITEETADLSQEPLSEAPAPIEPEETEPEETEPEETEPEETEPEETETEETESEQQAETGQQEEEEQVSQPVEIRESPAFDAVLEAGNLTVRLHADPGILPEGAGAEVR